MRAVAQQLQRRVISNLDATSCHQGRAAGKVRTLLTFGEVELRTRRAKQMIEVMDLSITLSADVTESRASVERVIIGGIAGKRWLAWCILPAVTGFLI
jgi:hypothetical protein